MPKVLTPDIVMMRSKTNDPLRVNSVMLWGMGIEDISCLSMFPNLKIVSLTDNRIQNLQVFRSMEKLEEVYIRKNFISDVSEIGALSGHRNLRRVWVSENPFCLSLPNYRSSVLGFIPHIVVLDENPVGPEERINTQMANIKERGEYSHEPKYKKELKIDNGGHQRASSNNRPPSGRVVFKNAGANFLDEFQIQFRPETPLVQKNFGENNQEKKKENQWFSEKRKPKIRERPPLPAPSTNHIPLLPDIRNPLRNKYITENMIDVYPPKQRIVGGQGTSNQLNIDKEGNRLKPRQLSGKHNSNEKGKPDHPKSIFDDPQDLFFSSMNNFDMRPPSSSKNTSKIISLFSPDEQEWDRGTFGKVQSDSFDDG